MENKNVKLQETHDREISPKTLNGMVMLVINIIFSILATAAVIFAAFRLENTSYGSTDVLGIVLMIVGLIYLTLIMPYLFAGLRILKPNEAIVLTLFGKYFGSLKGEGFYFVNPFATAISPENRGVTSGAVGAPAGPHDPSQRQKSQAAPPAVNKKISLKAMTLNNDKQKINDALGNPIIIGIVLIWRVVNTAKAVFNVDYYPEYLSIQTDAALRNVIRLYPYDLAGDDNEKTLRASSQEVALKLKEEIQEKVEMAGLEILEARITHLSYAPEIAAAMLQRQQASALIDARQMIVEGAVGMVEMALKKLKDNDVIDLDDERKAQMVSNLLVVLCGNRDTQPVVNTGSLY